MKAKTLKPVLILGGSGFAGSRTARALRTLHPDLQITIGGRDRARAQAVADEIGNATAAVIDLKRRDLGLPEGLEFSAVAVILKDLTLNSLRYAQAHGLPYMCCADGAIELSPLVAQFASDPSRSPVLMLGHWMGGTTTMATLYFCQDFRSVESIEVGIVYDPAGESGPVAREDFERAAAVAPSPLMLNDGMWRFELGAAAARVFKGVAGEALQGNGVSLVDVTSLAVATGAPSVRVDLAIASSQGTLRGDPASHEIVVEIAGERKDGATGKFRYEISDSAGFSTMSGRGMALSIERLLGLSGPAPKPGLYNPENLLDPTYVVDRMRQFGTRLAAV